MANILAARGQQQVYDAVVTDQLDIRQHRNSQQAEGVGPYLAAQRFQVRRVNRPLEFRPELLALALGIPKLGVLLGEFFELGERQHYSADQLLHHLDAGFAGAD